MNRNSGDQRLSIKDLRSWEARQYGMFIHFGMSTFDGDEHSRGDQPSRCYAPDQLDVGQWIGVARDAGMKYAVLTAKHHSGHCLWPSALNDYHVGTSGNPTDVVAAYVKACEKCGLMPGLYYCSLDNHNTFNSLTSGLTQFTTSEYQEFQWRQLEELLTRYGPIGEVWIDIPGAVPRDYRNKLYVQIAAWQPAAVIVMNHGIADASVFNVNYAWPTDIVTIERHVPGSARHQPWREIEGKRYYLPGEVCDTIGAQWFYVPDDRPREDAELLGMYLLSTSRAANLLLDVPPDKHGLIPPMHVDALQRLRKNLGTFGIF